MRSNQEVVVLDVHTRIKHIRSVTVSYKPYWKSEFQRCLTAVNQARNILGWREVSDSIANNGFPIWEYVYEIRLKNSSASLIVFSSVDKNTDRSREVSSDAVRVVYQWSTKNGSVYSKVCKKYRVESLFANLQKAIISASNECFNLENRHWIASKQEAFSN